MVILKTLEHKAKAAKFKKPASGGDGGLLVCLRRGIPSQQHFPQSQEDSLSIN